MWWRTLKTPTTYCATSGTMSLRSITRPLYPSIIRMGLPSALNALADRFRSVFEVELEIDEAVAELESPVKPGLEEPVRLALYRVAEEALGNVAKHSEAAQARVSVALLSSEEIRLVIQDNGQGFDPAVAARGHGLLSMEDYVTALGGTLEMKSGDGSGTTVKVLIPIACPQPSRLGELA